MERNLLDVLIIDDLHYGAVKSKTLWNSACCFSLEGLKIMAVVFHVKVLVFWFEGLTIHHAELCASDWGFMRSKIVWPALYRVRVVHAGPSSISWNSNVVLQARQEIPKRSKFLASCSSYDFWAFSCAATCDRSWNQNVLDPAWKRPSCWLDRCSNLRQMLKFNTRTHSRKSFIHDSILIKTWIIFLQPIVKKPSPPLRLRHQHSRSLSIVLIL